MRTPASCEAKAREKHLLGQTGTSPSPHGKLQQWKVVLIAKVERVARRGDSCAGGSTGAATLQDPETQALLTAYSTYLYLSAAEDLMCLPPARSSVNSWKGVLPKRVSFHMVGSR